MPGRNPNHSEPGVGWMSLSITHAKGIPARLDVQNESGIDRQFGVKLPGPVRAVSRMAWLKL
ncbi:hypothetical protein N7520_009243 [Penicillium odoratum]|uniref:uncharacterized protein n=1 Tax=Penicillium odoratum TaxID=1167516 RepID=UPI002547BC51|nr:uncharacterized protein N7520_009243 [Penicillium odoratum]KAJ5752326.1 hypothetical protein N7520_009243 [Penicillium odoratum]